MESPHIADQREVIAVKVKTELLSQALIKLNTLINSIMIKLKSGNAQCSRTPENVIFHFKSFLLVILCRCSGEFINYHL